jgi:hypothetical protein
MSDEQDNGNSGIGNSDDESKPNKPKRTRAGRVKERQPFVRPETQEKKIPYEPGQEPSKQRHRPERERRKMLAMYLRGYTQAEVAKFFNTYEHTVSKIALKYKWKEKKKEFTIAAHEGAKLEMRDLGASIGALAQIGVRQRLKYHQENPSAIVSIETMEMLRKLAEFINKEARLDDGKPTVNTSGVVRHEIVLPPNATRWGIEAPSTSVKVIEADEIEVSDAKPSDDSDV